MQEEGVAVGGPTVETGWAGTHTSCCSPCCPLPCRPANLPSCPSSIHPPINPQHGELLTPAATKSAPVARVKGGAEGGLFTILCTDPDPPGMGVGGGGDGVTLRTNTPTAAAQPRAHPRRHTLPLLQFSHPTSPCLPPHPSPSAQTLPPPSSGSGCTGSWPTCPLGATQRRARRCGAGGGGTYWALWACAARNMCCTSRLSEASCCGTSVGRGCLSTSPPRAAPPRR